MFSLECTYIKLLDKFELDTGPPSVTSYHLRYIYTYIIDLYSNVYVNDRVLYYQGPSDKVR